MALCNICLNIPFLSLSKAPLYGLGSYDYHGIFRLYVPDLAATPYYDKIAALEASSQSCSICYVVRNGVQKWAKKWEKFPNKRFSVHPRLGMDAMPENEPLVLTQCASGPQGFIVWSNDPGRKHMYEILAVVGFAVDRASPLAEFYLMRPFHEDSGSKHSLDVAAAWVQTCCDEHEKCRNDPAPLPTRVLDVGSTGDLIRLLSGSGIRGKYSCLSYCWGDATPFTTTRETMGRKESGFEIGEAPQTLQDAVTITRHLGLRYLWVDALCIIQEDVEDWARESSRMTEIYSNAHVVLAADWGKDSTSGIFHKRARVNAMFDLPGGYNGLQAILFNDLKQYHGYCTDLEEQPLNCRGWTLQERVLATRILHYTSTQMYFECEHGITSEEGPTGEDRFCSLKDDRGYRRADLVMNVDGKWADLIEDYGRRELTRATDRLPAISGLAKLFKQLKGVPEYVAGLWSDDFISELSWQPSGLVNRNNSTPFTAYVGPSWSWVSLNGAATYQYATSWVHIAEVVGWTVKVKGENNPYGELESASIQIRGPVIRAKPSTCSVNRKLPQQFWVCTGFSTIASGTECRMDHGGLVREEQWRSWDLQILLLRGWAEPESQPPVSCFGLVLRRSSDHEGGAEAWERVGCVEMSQDDLPVDKAVELLDAKDKWETLILV